MITKISPDQNSVELTCFKVEFYAVKKLKKNQCHHCLLFKLPGVECKDVPCRSWERQDGQNGVFSVRQMPKKHGKS